MEKTELECQRTLDSLLLEPIQRVPRYELLLKDLLKHTPEVSKIPDPTAAYY